MEDDVETRRVMISKVYDTDTWHDKVRIMSDAQVIAIYLRFKREGKL